MILNTSQIISTTILHLYLQILKKKSTTEYLYLPDSVLSTLHRLSHIFFKLSLELRKLRYYNIVIYKKCMYLVTEKSKIKTSFIVGLHPQFLAHSSQNPRNFLRVKSKGSIFVVFEL